MVGLGLFRSWPWLLGAWLLGHSARTGWKKEVVRWDQVKNNGHDNMSMEEDLLQLRRANCWRNLLIWDSRAQGIILFCSTVWVVFAGQKKSLSVLDLRAITQANGVYSLWIKHKSDFCGLCQWHSDVSHLLLLRNSCMPELFNFPLQVVAFYSIVIDRMGRGSPGHEP